MTQKSEQLFFRTLCVIMGFFCIFFMNDGNTVPPGYISPYNGYCNETTSKDEILHAFVANDLDAGRFPPPNYSLFSLDDMAHYLQTESFYWANPAFQDSTGAWWSDTYGVCALFTDTQGLIFEMGTDIINDQEDIQIWNNITVGYAAPAEWRLIFVDDIQIGNFIGYTPNNTDKLTICEWWVGSKVILHEWGHTNNVRPNPVGGYSWPTVNSIHYGNEARYYHDNLNIMYTSADIAGTDGDINFKFIDYPWITPNWWTSKRWDVNY